MNEFELYDELLAIKDAVNDFCDVMQVRMNIKAREGWQGWNNPANQALFEQRLQESVAKQEWVNVANYAMMLERIKAASNE